MVTKFDIPVQTCWIIPKERNIPAAKIKWLYRVMEIQYNPRPVNTLWLSSYKIPYFEIQIFNIRVKYYNIAEVGFSHILITTTTLSIKIIFINQHSSLDSHDIY
jgi:hypothetical protein